MAGVSAIGMRVGVVLYMSTVSRLSSSLSGRLAWRQLSELETESLGEFQTCTICTEIYDGHVLIDTKKR